MEHLPLTSSLEQQYRVQALELGFLAHILALFYLWYTGQPT